MKRIWNSVCAAFSVFSVLPMPWVDWKSYNLRGTLAALPLVGVLAGGVCILYYYLSVWLKLPIMLSAAVYTVVPVALSGGIHMDGFADTTDALSSHADPEKKRQILKDPHAGAFAVIGVACLLIIHFGLCCALTDSINAVLLFSLTHVLSRTAGALASCIFPMSGNRGMLSMLRDDKPFASVIILILWAAAAFFAAALISPYAAAVMAVLCALVLLYVRRMAAREFGGMSGDIAGYLITLCEVVLLAGIVLTERITAL